MDPPATYINFSRKREVVTSTTHTTVRLPDLWASFFAIPPPSHPETARGRYESEGWLASFCSLSPDYATKLSSLNCTIFTTGWMHSAPYAALRVANDWIQWIFPFDDLFDDGTLRGDIERATSICQTILAGMESNVSPEKLVGGPVKEIDLPERYIAAHQDIWLYFRELAPPSVQGRYKHFTKGYLDGLLDQVRDQEAVKSRNIEEMLALRVGTVGCYPCFPFVQLGLGIELPQAVVECEAIKEIERQIAEFVIIHNDTYSYKKEENDEIPNSMVSACRAQGMSAQQAFDEMGKMLDTRHERMQRAETALPSWGKGVDHDVAKYIEGLKDIARANLNWGFTSPRYFGEMGVRVKNTRRMDVLISPPYLKKSE